MENITVQLPSISIYLDIINATIDTWSTCTPWATSPWEVEFLFYMSMTLALFYLYVIVVILVSRVARGQFKSTFYNCALFLAVGDIGTLLACSRATIPGCALGTDPARFLAWESLTVFCVDLIYGANLVMATVRFFAVNNSAKGKKSGNWFLNGFLFLEFFWSLAMGILCFNGLMKVIWFTGWTYHSEFLFPFDYFRTQFNMAQLAATFLIYCVAFVRLRQVSLSTKSRLQQYRFMVLAVLIFICELLFIYASDWVGSTWGIGDDLFNARVSNFGRPITTGITPLFYVIFSSEVREACGFSLEQKRNGVGELSKATMQSVQSTGGNMRKRMTPITLT